MRYIFSTTVAIILLSPFFVQAACLESGYTVVYVNGILNTREQAEQSSFALQQKLKSTYKGEQVIVKLGYNPSHVGGLGDLVQVAAQSFGTSVSSFDRDTILLQIHPEVTTRKVFLVGHSQGTFYTNDMYGYLLNNGEPKEAVGVYNVATPAGYVAGGGAYLTSEYDSIISAYAGYVKQTGALPPLPPNSELEFGSAMGNGHSFTDNYLAYGGERVAQDIQKGLAQLRSIEGTATDGCFTPPEEGLGYKTKEVFFAVADPAAVGIKVAAATGIKGAALAIDGVASGLAAVGSLFGGVAKTITPQPRTENLPGSHNIVKALYGSSLAEDDLQDLLATQKPAVVNIDKKEEGEVRGVEIEISEPTLPSADPPPAPVVPIILPPSGTAVVSPGFGGGGGAPASTPSPAPVVGAPSIEEATSTGETATSSDEVIEADSEPPPPIEVVVREFMNTSSIDSFSICDGNGCNDFSGISGNWVWFNFGDLVFNKMRVFLSTVNLGVGETLTGRVRLHVYAADTNFLNRVNEEFIRGNLLYVSDWVSLESFSTPDNVCDQYYTGGFRYEDCIFPFIFSDPVVMQSGHAYILAFEGEHMIGTLPSNPAETRHTQLITLCSAASFIQHLNEFCKRNYYFNMIGSFIQVGSIASTTPSPLDIWGAP